VADGSDARGSVVGTLDAAACLVVDGSTVALGGLGGLGVMNRPSGLVRALM
jgi:hypothetical protein